MAGLESELRQANETIARLQAELDDERAAAAELQTQAASALETQEMRIQELEAELAAAQQNRSGISGTDDQSSAEATQLRESLMAVQMQLSSANEELAKRHGQTIRLEAQLREKTQAVAALQERQQGLEQANARAEELAALVEEKDGLMGEFIEATKALEAEKQQFMAEADAARAELEQAAADRRELAGQVRALLEEKAKRDGELAGEKEGREQFQQRVREQVELRLGVLQARVEELASRDTLLLSKLADAANQVGSARAAVEAETARRREAEGVLREATDLFKRELWEKQEELRGLASQLHQLRDWHGRFMEALGHDVRATARILGQPSVEPAYVPRPGPPRAYSQPPTGYTPPPQPSSQRTRAADAIRAGPPRTRVAASPPAPAPEVAGSWPGALFELASQKPPEVENELRRLRKIRHEYQAALSREDSFREKSRASTRPDKPPAIIFPSSDSSKDLFAGGWGHSKDLNASTGALLKGTSAVTGHELSMSSSTAVVGGAGWQAALLSKLGMAQAALDAKLGAT